MVQQSLTLPNEGMCSSQGHVRPLNEDSYGSFRSVFATLDHQQQAVLRQKGHLYIVADGMGGHDSGDVASATAVQQISAAYYNDDDPDRSAALQRAVASANHTIYLLAQERKHAPKRPMGTTVTCALFWGTYLVIAHVGDSRAYRLHDGQLDRLTDDHDWVTQEMHRSNIDHSEAEHRAQQRGTRGMLLRAVGVRPQVAIDMHTIDWCADDTLLLCSDGLHGTVSKAVIAQILAAHQPQVAARKLVQAANAAGGPDNSTVLVVRSGHAIAVPLGARQWRKAAQGVIMPVAVVLSILGLTVPIANGHALVSPNNEIRALAGFPTLPPTSTLQPSATTQAEPPSPTFTQVPSATPYVTVLAEQQIPQQDTSVVQANTAQQAPKVNTAATAGVTPPFPTATARVAAPTSPLLPKPSSTTAPPQPAASTAVSSRPAVPSPTVVPVAPPTSVPTQRPAASAVGVPQPAPPAATPVPPQRPDDDNHEEPAAPSSQPVTPPPPTATAPLRPTASVPQPTTPPQPSPSPTQPPRPAAPPTMAPTQPAAQPTTPPRATAAPPEPTAAPPEPTAAPPEPTAAPPEPTVEPTARSEPPPPPTAAPPEPTAAPPEPTSQPVPEPTSRAAPPVEPTVPSAPTAPPVEPTAPSEPTSAPTSAPDSTPAP